MSVGSLLVVIIFFLGLLVGLLGVLVFLVARLPRR